MRAVFRTRALAATLIGIATFAVTGCASPLVGGECKTGFTARGGQCLPTDGGGMDGGGVDGGRLDAAGMDGGIRDAAPSDAIMPDAPPRDAMRPDSGPPPCDIGERLCMGECVRPDIDPMHCGDCTTVCGTDVFCVDGDCTAMCDPPLTNCGGLCVDLTTDYENCGVCGRSCPSGICVDSACVDATFGHLVVIGHTYRNTNREMNRVAGNAVFLARGNPVRTLVYEGDADARSIAGVDRAVDQVAMRSGRSWVRFAGNADEIPFALGDAEAFLIYPQEGATNEALLDLGRMWSVALSSFVRRGGVIVVFDGPATHDGTYQVLEAAGLFAATGRIDVTDDVIDVVAPGDAVAVGVAASYRGETATMRFETSEETVVVRHVDGPVVIHKAFAP